MHAIVNQLKKSKFLQRLNKLPFLLTDAYCGTSGACIISPELNSFIHVFNSYSHLENDPGPHTFTLILQCGNHKKTLDFQLGFQETKIINPKDYFTATTERKFISFRLFHKLPKAIFVPYCFVSLIHEAGTYSTVHSSSFGSSKIQEFVSYSPDYLFSKAELLRCELILSTLYAYAPKEESTYHVHIENLSNPSKRINFAKLFKGDICVVDFLGVKDFFTEDSVYRLQVDGPAHANMYVLMNNRNLFHF